MDNFDSILNVNAVNTNDKTSVFAAESKENRNRCYDMSEHMTEKVAADAKSLQNNFLMFKADLTDIRQITLY